MDEHLRSLNSEQRKAASHTDGPLLIVAGAGAGKTKTITHRIVNLIKKGVPPESILAVTFTNKAAKEMRERVINEVEKSAPGQDRVPFVSTFHSLGVHIIKENARLLGLTRYFTVLDERDSTTLIKSILKDIGIDPKQYDPKKIKNIISAEKNKFILHDQYVERKESPWSRLIAQVWPTYEKKKKQENSLDFDDLLLWATKLLKENEDIRKVYQARWKYIHIDEYQDTNEVQYMMSRLLSEDNKNICVVGDADQNIYSWRGANLKNILNFERDYPGATIVLLEENYRSTKNILEAANEVIKKNKYRPDKNLFTKNKTGEKIGLYDALDESDEAEYIATKILEIKDRSTPYDAGASASVVSGQGLSQADGPRGSAPSADGDSDPAMTQPRRWSNIAVLYRANFQSRALEEAMLNYNIPYQVLGIKFFERKEIKDTLAYLRAALNKDSLSDIKRIINFPKRGIGKVTLAKIFAGDTESLPAKTQVKIDGFYQILVEIREKIKEYSASEVIKYVVKASGIERELADGTEEEIERLENIKELATLAIKYDRLEGEAGLPAGSGIEKLLEDAALASDQDSLMINDEKKKRENSVKLMTVHASKGLEFEYVFVTGLEDGLFPHQRRGEGESSSAVNFAEAMEEERRLFYVAITRAKEKLFLSFADFRTIFGSRQINTLSEFIADIPPDLLEKENEKSGIKTIYLD